VTADVTVDTLGRRCPIPVIELAKHIADVEVGGVVAVLSDDEAARVDIPVWCRMKGHEYAGAEPEGTGTRHLVRRQH
jgi:TusA-related sulfurtransferase